MRLFVTILILFLFSVSSKAQDEIDTTKSNLYYSIAEEAINNGNFEKGVSYLEEALILNPKNVDVYNGLSYVSFEKNEYKKSVEYASNGINIYRNNNLKKDDVYLNLIKLKGYSLSFSMKYKESIPYFTELIDADKSDFYNYFRRAIAFFELDSLDKAYSDIQTAYNLNNSHVSVNVLYGQILFEKNDFKTAIIYFSQANNLEVRDPVTYYYLGLSYLHLEDLEKSIQNFEIYLNHPLAELREPFKEREAKFYLARLYFLFEQYDKALTLFEQIQDHLLKGSENYMLAYSLLHNNKLKEAQTFMEDKKKEFPKEGAFDKTLGDLFILKEDTINAKKSYSSAIKKGSEIIDTLEFYKTIANSYAQINDTLGAIRSLKTAAELLPNSISVYQSLLDIYFLNDSIYAKELIKTLDRLSDISTDPEKAAFYAANKGVMQMYYGEDKEQAINAMSRAIELHPFHEYYAMRAFLVIYEELGKIKSQSREEFSKEVQEQVLKDIDKALETDKREKDAYLLKTTLLMAFERNEEACQAANKAVEHGAEISRAHLKYLCKGKKPKNQDKHNEWEFFYDLSNFGERFSE